MSFPNNPVYPGAANPMLRGVTSLTNPYWIPEPELQAKNALLPIDHHLGFSISKPWPLPPPRTLYNGAGPVPGVREMVFTQFTESNPVGGKLPYSGKRPLVRPSEFRRSQFIHVV